MTDKQIIIDEIKLHGNRKDLTGLKVGKLTCLKPVKTGKYKNSEWLCECECGNFKIAKTYRLLSGRIQSCGDCYHTINHYIPMIKELEKQLKRKKQECEFSNLRIIQLQETLSQYEADLSTKDCIVETCKAQYKELKAENDDLKKYKDVVDKLAGMQVILTNEEKMPMLYENAKDLKLKQLSKTLIDIKEIADKEVNNRMLFADKESFCDFNKILQKIKEVLE